MGIVRRRVGARGGSGGLGASTMAHYLFVDRGVGLFRKYGPAAGKGQWEAGAQGGSWRRRSRSPEQGDGRVHPVPHKSRAPARSVHPVPHKSRAPARSVQAAHWKGGGPVARGRGGRALIGRSRPWPQCGQRLTSVPSTRERKASTVSGSAGAGVGASSAARQAARCSVRWRLARRP